MQACPYDALYIDPNSNTAAKCNFCAHRVEANLEPACVIVCPTQAITAGDLDEPTSKIGRIVATQKVSVRKPEKGTQPKLYYVGIEGDILQPTRLSHQNGYAFAEPHNATTKVPDFDPAVSREVYDVAHPAPWGWRIGAYLWTKSIAAGVMLVAALLHGRTAGPLATILSPIIALMALGLTGLLLIFDLKRPDRFYYLLTKPNFRSWLVIGAFILMGFGALCTAWLLFGAVLDEVPGLLMIATAVFAVGSACYSAFLFAQAKGRDLWQSPLFFWHLLVQAMVAGSAIWLLSALYLRPRITWPAHVLLLISLGLSLCMTLTELALPHASEDVRLARHALIRGRLRSRFWNLAIGAGLALPILLLSSFSLPLNGPVLAAASILALAGVWWFEDLWVKAGQSVPLS
jgi:formate-dependent nitrite reductase membrane component NrfD